MIKAGYRNYDCPVAMPDMGYKNFTLDEYFTNLNKLDLDSEESVRSKQIAGTHYQKDIQPWDIISAWELDFWEGNVVKYILRWKDKDGVQDLKKAKHYIEYLIERESNDN